MTNVLVIAVAGGLAFAAPALAARVVDGRTSPRLAATVHVLALVAIGVVPIALLVCLAAPSSLLAGRCHGPLKGHGHLLRWGALSSAGIIGLWLGSVAFLTLRATRRATPGVALSQMDRSEATGVPLYVLPVDPPVAFATGVSRGQVVVSEGLIRLLDEDELRAALAHEVSHVRGGHHRLLFIGRAVERAFGILPPVRRAFASLRRELEAAADDEAAEVVGDRRVVARAIAKVALATSSPVPGIALADETDVAFRVRRLLGQYPESQPRRAVALGLAGLLASGIVAAQCEALHPGVLWTGLAACSLLVGWIGLRPFRPAKAWA